ncbi:uncharacterized protein DS421_11g337700 [Arachis hypogaea]|nr:uncharacterized protein DS421_11g337700 [Arachis hypogaea]
MLPGSPPHSTPCRRRCTPKGERERDTESASRREGLAASSIVFTALPPSSSQPWREHSAAVSPDQKRARDQERNVESATHREALAAAVARRRVLSLLFEQSSSPPFYCSGRHCNLRCELLHRHCWGVCHRSDLRERRCDRRSRRGVITAAASSWVPPKLPLRPPKTPLPSPENSSVDPPELLVVAGAVAGPVRNRSCFVSLCCYGYCERDLELRFRLLSVRVEAGKDSVRRLGYGIAF